VRAVSVLCAADSSECAVCSGQQCDVLCAADSSVIGRQMRSSD
jgi:hypothetical protein